MSIVVKAECVPYSLSRVWWNTFAKFMIDIWMTSGVALIETNALYVTTCLTFSNDNYHSGTYNYNCSSNNDHDGSANYNNNCSSNNDNNGSVDYNFNCSSNNNNDGSSSRVCWWSIHRCCYHVWPLSNGHQHSKMCLWEQQSRLCQDLSSRSKFNHPTGRWWDKQLCRRWKRSQHWLQYCCWYGRLWHGNCQQRHAYVLQECRPMHPRQLECNYFAVA